jgi:DNA-binding NarL/FixJ family response regulator
VRPSRVIYVENDPALRGIMTGMLAARPEIELLLSTGSAQKALDDPAAEIADVALLDVALGAESMDGMALGCALRERNPDIGLVLHSQHPLPQLPSRVPAAQNWGWSTLHKRAHLDIDELVAVLVNTAAGHVHRDAEPDEAVEDDPVSRLTARQRQIMSLVAAGWDNRAIADNLGMNVDAVRQDMSRAYKVLVPETAPGRDLRTTAVLIYLRHARGISVDPDG